MPDLPVAAITAAFRKARGGFVSAAIFSFFINLLMLTGPLFMLQVYDRVLTSQSFPTLLALLGLAAMLLVFMGLLDFVRSRILVRSSSRIYEAAKADIFNAMVGHRLQRTPNVHAMPVRDLALIRNYISGPGPAALFDMPWVPVFIGVNFLLHWVLGVFSLAAALVLIFLSGLNEVVTRGPLASVAQTTGQAGAMTDQALQNAEVLKAMGMLKAFHSRWAEIDGKARAAFANVSDFTGSLGAFTKSLRLLLQACVLATGASLAIAGEITAGSMVAASIILSRALAPLEQSIQQWRGFVSARAAYWRLKQVCPSSGEHGGSLAEETRKMPLPKVCGQLSLDKVKIAAPGGTAILLSDVAFDLAPGAGLGIIGASGAGKSTLIRTLVGLWPPVAGTVRLDGAELAHFPAAELGWQIGYLPQDIALFEASVKQNIARLAEDPNPAAVVKAARLAGAHDMIQALPEGYNTGIGGDGVVLSAGQQQRIALARAFYGKPGLIVLDEPNAHLDADGEAALVRAVRELRQQGVTVVLAAHRPSALAAVSHLIFVQNGRQADFGPRDALLKRVTVAHEKRGSGAAATTMRGPPPNVAAMAPEGR